MPQHSTQLNDYTASVSMDYFFSRVAYRWRAPVPFSVHPRSENQLAEGTLGGLIQNPDSPIAHKAFVDLLDNYTTFGHQGKEFGTPSHSPHWYRTMSVALKWAIDHRSTHIDVFVDVLRWWCFDAWVRDQYRVPSGPLHDHIIGWGARFNNNGDNDVRNVIDALLRGQKTTKGKKFFDNAAVSADTFGALVVASLVRDHSDVLAMIKPVRPVISFDLSITKTDEALTCTCKNPDAKDPHVVNVDYKSGKVSVS